ncbi:MAG: serine/threonine protein kinase [Bacteroidales bacterium]|nr:serine/threonine protein kinase [Bacteroidales bacterium]
MQLKQGTLLQGGKYRIEKVLGQGGFGITYLACQTGLNRKVAVKEFFMQEYCNRDAGTSRVSVPSMGSRELVERYRQKFLKEARLIASFDNNNIIKIYDVFEDNSTAYYVMEYLEGKSLKAVLEECGPLPEDLALKYIRQISLALAEVHASNLLHLDVKPANIMLNKKGEAVLIDFGISKHYDEGGKQTSSALAGTSEGYAPLEQYEAGALDSFAPATDIYALGATLFCLLAGMRPPKASEVMNHGLPELPLDISSAVREAVTAAMQPIMRMRPQSVEEFLELLKDSKDLKDPKDLNEETVLPDERAKQSFDRFCGGRSLAASQNVMPSVSQKSKAIKEQSEAIRKIDNEETRAVEKETERVTAKISDTVAKPNKNSTGLVAAVVLVGILIAGVLYFYNSLLEKVEHERIALIEQQRQDSIDAATRKREEQTRLERERVAANSTISTCKKVDIGLSVCWAGWNVGASSPEDYGNYYAWGETTIKSDYTENSYQYHNSNDYIDIGRDISGTSYDVARTQWGGSWRLPTKTECQELIDRCTWTWTNYKGINGYKVTGPNGKSIFLPAAGWFDFSPNYHGTLGEYSSATSSEYNSHYCCLYFGSSCYYMLEEYRYNGYSVRPVCNK